MHRPGIKFPIRIESFSFHFFFWQCLVQSNRAHTNSQTLTCIAFSQPEQTTLCAALLLPTLAGDRRRNKHCCRLSPTRKNAKEDIYIVYYGRTYKHHGQPLEHRNETTP